MMDDGRWMMLFPFLLLIEEFGVGFQTYETDIQGAQVLFADPYYP